MTRAELAAEIERLCNDPDRTDTEWLEATWENATTLLAALREPDEAAVERAGRELAALEVPKADWREDFSDQEREDYRRCAGDILRAAREG